MTYLDYIKNKTKQNTIEYIMKESDSIYMLRINQRNINAYINGKRSRPYRLLNELKYLGTGKDYTIWDDDNLCFSCIDSGKEGIYSAKNGKNNIVDIPYYLIIDSKEIEYLREILDIKVSNKFPVYFFFMNKENAEFYYNRYSYKYIQLLRKQYGERRDFLKRNKI